MTCIHVISHTFSNFPVHTLPFHTCTKPHLYTILLTASGGVDGLDIWSWLTRRENEGELHREERKTKKRQNLEERKRFSEAACRKEAEGNDPGSKKERDAERKRKTEELSREAKEEDV